MTESKSFADLPQMSALELLQFARQYQQDWVEHGVNRVHLYFDDVEDDWLEEWGLNTNGTDLF